MEGKFYRAAITGDQGLLNQLVDSISVDGAEFVKETPLHIAAKYGHPNIVRKILRQRPKFAFGLNWEGQTPLHLASAKGHLDAVKVLLGENNNDQSQQRKLSDACFIRDKQGRSPLHLAAMNGHVEVLRGLVQTESAAAWVVTDRGQSSLHLCAHNDHFAGVEELINLVSEKVVFINNLKDDDDNNILHLLAAKRQYKMIQRLVNDNKGVDINGMNRERDTVLDVALKKQSSIRDFIEIIRFVVSTGAKERSRKAAEDTLLLVVSLMAAITFHAPMNPQTYLVFIASLLLLIIVFTVPMFFPRKFYPWVVGIAAFIAFFSINMVATISFQAALKPSNPSLIFKASPVLFILFLTITKLLLRKVSTWILIIAGLISCYFLAMVTTILISSFNTPPETDLAFTASNNMESAAILLLSTLITVEILFPGKFSTWGLIIAALIAVYLYLPLLSSDDTVLVSVKKYLIQHVQVVAGAYLSIISMYKFFTEHVQVVAAVFASIMLTYKFFIAHSHKFFVWILVRE